MTEDERIVLRTGDAKIGSCCRVIGREIFQEHWGPNGHVAEGFMVLREDLDDAHLERGRVTLLGHHIRHWSAHAPQDWVYTAPTHPVEVPVQALVEIFKDALPERLRV